MSLGAIDFGIIVDGAVIIVEGTVHEIEKRIKAGKGKFAQAEMDELTYHASSTMMNSAFFGQLIILIVLHRYFFLPGWKARCSNQWLSHSLLPSLGPYFSVSLMFL